LRIRLKTTWGNPPTANGPRIQKRNITDFARKKVNGAGKIEGGRKKPLEVRIGIGLDQQQKGEGGKKKILQNRGIGESAN